MAEPKDIDLKALVSKEISAAESDDNEQAAKRAKAMRYFLGEVPDIVAEAGRSSVVSRDVSDTVRWTLPQLMRVFMASEQIVIVEPVGMEDEAISENATAGLNYIFWKDNPGYQILRDATWDALVNADAIVKVYWDDTPQYAVSWHTGLTEDQRAELLLPEHGEEPEVLAASDGLPMTLEDPENPGAQLTVPTFDLKIKRCTSKGRAVIECIPREDYGRDGDAKSPEDARFQYHKRQRTRSQLIEMGFDRETVESLGVSPKVNDAQKQAREVQGAVESAADTSMEIIDLYECFIMVDVDDDGIAEMVRCYYAGAKGAGELLRAEGWSEPWEVWEDESVFFKIPYDPVPHRFDSQSSADQTMEPMRVKTVLQRQALDNLYATNNPQRFVVGDIINPEELFSPSFGGAVFGRENATVTPLTVPFVADKAFAGIEYQDEVIQRRTGVGRQTMALDPDALQNQTAEAARINKDAGYSQTELVARDMAELGWKAVFRALLKLTIKHQDQPRVIRVAKKPFRIDPRYWNADADCTVNVGLGTGSRDRDLSMLSRILETQLMLADRFMASGAVEDAIDMLPLILKTLEKMAESAGLRGAQDYYPEYTEEKVAKLKAEAAKQGQQPPKELLIEQARQQGAEKLAATEGQITMQVEQGKNQLAAQQAELKAQGDVVKNQAELEADLQTQAAARETQIVIERMKQEGEDRRKMMDIQWQRERAAQQDQLAREGMMNSAAMADRNNAARAEMADRKPQPDA